MRHTPIQRLRVLALLAIGFTMGTASQGQAQGFISPLIGYDFSGDARCPRLTDCEDAKVNVSVSVGAMGRLLGFEVEVAYAPDFFGKAPALSSSVLTLMSNVMLVPKLGRVRPYVLAGVGLMKTHVELTQASIVTTDNNNLGWDVGGGLIGLLGAHVGVRGDLRYFHAFQDLSVLGFTLRDSKLDYGRASVGVILTF